MFAAEAGVPGRFDPPLCVFHELPDWLGTADMPVGDYERLVLIGRILRDVWSAYANATSNKNYLRKLNRTYGSAS